VRTAKSVAEALRAVQVECGCSVSKRARSGAGRSPRARSGPRASKAAHAAWPDSRRSKTGCSDPATGVRTATRGPQPRAMGAAALDLRPLTYAAFNTFAAVTITFANKAVFSVFHFNFVYVLTLIHALATVAGMHAFAAAKMFEAKPLKPYQVRPRVTGAGVNITG